MKKYHYVYKITNLCPTDERKYYIGLRTSDLLPEEDNKYWSSSAHLKESIKKNGQENFTKEILSIWNSREEAAFEERRLLQECKSIWNEFYNVVLPTLNNFFMVGNFGRVTVFNKDTNNYEMIDNSDYFKNKSKYRTNATNKISIIDKFNGETKQINKDEFDNEKHIFINKNKTVYFDIILNKYVSIFKDEYDKDRHISATKNKTTVKCKKTNKFISISVEEFNKNKNIYQTATTNMVTVKNINTGEISSISKDEFKNNSIYVSINSKTIEIYDNNNNLRYTSYGNFLDFCERHNLPKRLKYSYQNNGEPIFSNPGSNLNKIIKNGEYKYVGWYAVIVDQNGN